MNNLSNLPINQQNNNQNGVQNDDKVFRTPPKRKSQALNLASPRKSNKRLKFDVNENLVKTAASAILQSYQATENNPEVIRNRLISIQKKEESEKVILEVVEYLKASVTNNDKQILNIIVDFVKKYNLDILSDFRFRSQLKKIYDENLFDDFIFTLTSQLEPRFQQISRYCLDILRLQQPLDKYNNSSEVLEIFFEDGKKIKCDKRLNICSEYKQEFSEKMYAKAFKFFYGYSLTTSTLEEAEMLLKIASQFNSTSLKGAALKEMRKYFQEHPIGYIAMVLKYGTSKHFHEIFLNPPEGFEKILNSYKFFNDKTLNFWNKGPYFENIFDSQMFSTFETWYTDPISEKLFSLAMYCGQFSKILDHLDMFSLVDGDNNKVCLTTFCNVMLFSTFDDPEYADAAITVKNKTFFVNEQVIRFNCPKLYSLLKNTQKGIYEYQNENYTNYDLTYKFLTEEIAEILLCLCYFPYYESDIAPHPADEKMSLLEDSRSVFEFAALANDFDLGQDFRNLNIPTDIDGLYQDLPVQDEIEPDEESDESSVVDRRVSPNAHRFGRLIITGTPE